MSDAAPPTAGLYARVLLPTAAVGLAIALAAPPLFDAMLGLDEEQVGYARGMFFLGVGGTLLASVAMLALGLRGVGGADRADRGARLRVLRLPVRLAGGMTLVGGAVTALAMLFRLATSRDAASLIFGVGLTTAASVGFLAVPVFVGARAALLRHALFFASEELPAARRVPIGLAAGYTVLSVAAIALVPAAVFGNARLNVARERAARERGRATAHRLAQVIERLSPTEAVQLVGRTHLENALVLLRMPSGALLPDDAALEAAGAAGEETLVGGELTGGAVRVIVRPRQGSQAPLLIVVVSLVGLAMLVATSLARALTRDARGVTRQVEALARGDRPPRLGTVSTTEVRRVALALNRLLERIPRLQMEKYLAVERAEESRRMKAMFLANMSHDLRSPLNSILGFSELLARGLEGPISDAQRAVLDDINGTGNQLLRLLSEILDTARAESGNLDLDRKPTPPATFVTLARKEALRGRPPAVGDQLTIDLQAGLAAVRVDALRIQQAITHALNWAIDAAQGQPVRVEVGDRDRPGGRALTIEVSCPRPTTAAEEALLFQPFRKAEGVAGLHLALPLAKRLVEAHGGTIEPYGEAVLGLRIALPRTWPER